MSWMERLKQLEHGPVRAPPPSDLFSMWSVQHGSFKVEKRVSYMSVKGSENAWRERERENDLGMISPLLGEESSQYLEQHPTFIRNLTTSTMIKDA